MTNLRDLARGQECQIRLPNICNGDPTTTVLAHYRQIGVSGMGMRAPDQLASWACSACHDAVDRRANTLNLTRLEVEHAHLEGIMRTQAALIRMGKL